MNLIDQAFLVYQWAGILKYTNKGKFYHKGIRESLKFIENIEKVVLYLVPKHFTL